MPETRAFDLIIRGGTVIDGSKAPRFDADVGIRDGRIAAIGDLEGEAAARIIDANGKIVAPGFIDSHTHDDSALLVEPEMGFKVSQGVTTVVAGNCGISVAPLKPGTPRPMPLGLLAAGGHDIEYTTFADYMAALRASPASVNVAPMVGHYHVARVRDERPQSRGRPSPRLPRCAAWSRKRSMPARSVSRPAPSIRRRRPRRPRRSSRSAVR